MGVGLRRPRRNRPGRHRRGVDPLVEHVEHEPAGLARRFSLPAPSPSSLVGIAVLVLIAAGAIHLGSSGSAVPLEEPTPVEVSATAVEEHPGPEVRDSDSPDSDSPDSAPAGTDPPSERDDAGEDGSNEQAPTEIVVHVSGAVQTPGVVRLSGAARVQDAVDAAGGPAPEADLAAVNLARPVTDGEQIHLPVPGEDPPVGSSVPGADQSTGGAPGSPPGTDGGGTGGGSLIDINTADAGQLEALPGVGPAIAERIIEHRESNGPFRSVDDLVEVSGIGPATLEKIRDKATVSG